MATTIVNGSNSPDNNVDITSGNTLDVQNGGTANTATVESGGVLQVDAGGTESGATIEAGGKETVTGTINGSNAVTTAANAGMDDDFGTINVGSGGVINTVTVENGGTLTLAKSASANNVTVMTGGTVAINGNAPANNVTLKGGLLDLQSAKADSTNTVTGVPTATGNLTFASGFSSTLQLDALQAGTNGTTFAQPITGFAQGDLVDLRAIAFSSTPTLTATQNGDGSTTVKVQIGTSTTATETFTFASTTASNFSIVSDNFAGPYPSGTTSPGTEIAYAAACYVTGTRIRTTRADVPVEALQVGDLAVTASGRVRPITWIGHREVACAAHPVPSEVWPVRVRAGAFGVGEGGTARPTRDLFLSHGHPVLVGDGEAEHLVPIMCLVNGTSIERIEVASTTYWHIELDAHDILLAEGLPAESFLDFGNRAWFAPDDQRIAADHALTNPDFVVPGLGARCRPVAVDGPVVEAERRRLDAVFATRLAAACAWPEASGWSIAL